MAKAYVGTLLGSYQSGVPMMGVVDLVQHSGTLAVVCHAGIWHSTWHTTFARSLRLGKEFARFWPPTLLGWIRRTMHPRYRCSRALPRGLFGQSPPCGKWLLRQLCDHRPTILPLDTRDLQARPARRCRVCVEDQVVDAVLLQTGRMAGAMPFVGRCFND